MCGGWVLAGSLFLSFFFSTVLGFPLPWLPASAGLFPPSPGRRGVLGAWFWSVCLPLPSPCPFHPPGPPCVSLAPCPGRRWVGEAPLTPPTGLWPSLRSVGFWFPLPSLSLPGFGGWAFLVVGFGSGLCYVCCARGGGWPVLLYFFVSATRKNPQSNKDPWAPPFCLQEPVGDSCRGPGQNTARAKSNRANTHTTPHHTTVQN